MVLGELNCHVSKIQVQYRGRKGAELRLGSCVGGVSSILLHLLKLVDCDLQLVCASHRSHGVVVDPEDESGQSPSYHQVPGLGREASESRHQYCRT